MLVTRRESPPGCFVTHRFRLVYRRCGGKMSRCKVIFVVCRCHEVTATVADRCYAQGSHASCKVLESPEICVKFLESPGKRFCLRKSFKFKLKVLESPRICWDADAMMRTRMQKYSHPHTSSFHDSFLQ